MSRIGQVANAHSNYLALLAIDGAHAASYSGSRWDAKAKKDVGDLGRATEHLQAGKWRLKVGKGVGIVAEIGGCGVADVFRFGSAIVVPEHYSGRDDADAEDALERTAAAHPTTRAEKLGRVRVASGVLVLKGLLEPLKKLDLSKVQKSKTKALELVDGVAVAVPPGEYEVWREEFAKPPKGAWGTMPSRVRVVPAGSEVTEGAPIAQPSGKPKEHTATRAERRLLDGKAPWGAIGSMDVTEDGRAFAGEVGKDRRVAGWNADGSLAFHRSLGHSTKQGRAGAARVQHLGDRVLVHHADTQQLDLISASNGETLESLTIPGDSARAVHLHGDVLIVRDGIETLLVAFPTMQLLSRFTEPYVNMNAIAVSSDGAYFAVVSSEAHVFDLRARKHLHSLDLDNLIWAATFTPDHLLLVGDDEARVLLLDPKTNKLLAKMDAAPDRKKKPTVRALAASARHIAAGRDDGTVVVIDRATKRIVKQFDKHDVSLPDTGACDLAAVSFSHAGRSLWVSAGPQKAPQGLSRYDVT